MLAAALTLFLTVAAVSPGLHEACHHHQHEAAADFSAGCVITQFGEGMVLLDALFVAVASPAPTPGEALRADGRSAGAEAEPGRLPPNRGPPVFLA